MSSKGYQHTYPHFRQHRSHTLDTDAESTQFTVYLKLLELILLAGFFASLRYVYCNLKENNNN